MPSFIPLEIVDHILEFCDDATFASCSLACKAWTPIAQSRLFRQLSIRTDKSYGVRLPGKLGIQNIEKNTKALELIQEIQFFLQLQFPSLTPDQLRSLISLIDRLRNKVNRLRQIEIYSHFLYPLSKNPILFSSISCSFAGILQLKIWMREENLPWLLRFACAFPMLQVLDLEFNAVSLRSDETECTCTLPTSLTAFRFEVFCPQEEAQSYYKIWLTSHPPRKIRNLRLGNWNLANEHFYAPNTTVTFILPRNSCLRSVFSILSSFTSSRLHKIVLIIESWCLETTTLEEATDVWVRLDDLVSAPPLSRTIIEIRIARDDSIQWDHNDIAGSDASDSVYTPQKDGIRTLLTKCSMQGRLLFTEVH
ncbi:hypothetical protein L218DRAFT_990436 [Marasmius fiardii PR-910]|nr:hypothetical protein L218DRAFT_990436 [Marasmius fiardii PR-910]